MCMSTTIMVSIKMYMSTHSNEYEYAYNGEY